MTTSVNGPADKTITLVNLDEQANIQVALNYAIFGNANGETVSANSIYANVPSKVQDATELDKTFSGNVWLPETTSIGDTTSTEIAYLHGVTNYVQTQFDDISKVDNFWFGDGSDGTTIISSGTTTLTRDMYYENLSISGTGKLNPNGFRIFVKGTLSLSSAPSDAITFTATNGVSIDTGAYYGKSTFATAANDVTAPTAHFDGVWKSAAGGNNTSSTTPTGAISWRRPAITFYAPFATGTISTGAGGSGGANGIVGGAAGGRGGTGNTRAFIYANPIALGTSNPNDGIISFVGGTASSGSSTATSGYFGGSGGGGGQGGIVYMVYKTVTGSMAATKYLVNCSGGSGGAGGTGGSGGGSGVGGQGGASGLIVFANIKTGKFSVPPATGITSTGSAATLPTVPTTATAGTGTTYKATPA